MTKKIFIICSVILFYSCMFIFTQSRIPGGTDDYLQVVNHENHGGRDLVNVIFFEVPDTMTSTLYFGIRDPEVNNVSPDQGTDLLETTYSLIGGPGTLSDSRSRQDYYDNIDITASHHKIGTLLSEYVYDNDFTAVQGEDPTGDNDWVYFPGVSPTQGEHIGNKYFFKIVTECESADVSIVFKNAYQLDISLNNTGDPTGISSVRAFSYSWMLCFQDRTTPAHIWEIYPFVPDSATGDIEFYNHDMDSAESPYAYYIDGTAAGAVTISADGSTGSVMTGFPIGSVVNGTWKLEVTETVGGPALNTSEIWFANSDSGEIYRAYAEHFVHDLPADQADHVAVSYDDGIALSGGADVELITLWLVDEEGTPSSYIKNIYVQLSGSAKIQEINGVNQGVDPPGSALVTTNSTGIANIKINNVEEECVTVSCKTDGTDGSTNLPNNQPNEAVTVCFQQDLPPIMVSASNLLFQQGTSAEMPVITITENGNTTIRDDSVIVIRIPSGLDASFDTGQTPVIGGTPGGTFQSITASTLTIDPAGDFSDGDTITITADLWFTSTNTESSGSLELSYNGTSGPFNVIDTRVVTVYVPTISYTWTGNGDTDTEWSDSDNWNPNTDYPRTTSDNAVIPPGLTNYPVLSETITIKHLSINSGATVDVNGNNFEVDGTFSNDGTLRLQGGESDISFLMDTDSGTVIYDGTAGPYTGLAAGDSYYNLEFNNSGTTWNLANDLTVHNNLLITAGTLHAQGNLITISGNWSNSDEFTHGSGTVIFTGTGESAISGNTTFYNFSCTTPGKTLRFQESLTQTIDTGGAFTISGTAANKINLFSQADGTRWTIDGAGANESVTNAGIRDSDVTGSAGDHITAANSDDLGNNDTAADPYWEFIGVTRTWTGSTDSDWDDQTNWSPGTNIPQEDDSIIIPDMTNDPTLNTDSHINNLTIESSGRLTIDANNRTLTINGELYNNGTIYRNAGDDITKTDIDSGLTVYEGADGLIQDYGPGIDYFKVTLDSGGATFSLGADLTIATDLEIAAGTTLNCSGYTLTAGGNITGAGTLIGGTGTVDVEGDLMIASYTATSGTTYTGRNWDISTGFTHSSGTVVFDGSGTSAVSGSNTFYNFTCTTPGKVLEFEESLTQAIDTGGTFTITGSAGNKICLFSHATGIQWTIDGAGASGSVTNARIRDSNVTGSAGDHITASTSDDLGNNDTAADPYWTFAGITRTWTGNTDSDWDDPDNWNPNTNIPQGDDTIEISDQDDDPVLNTNSQIYNLTIESSGRLTIDTINRILSINGELSNNGRIYRNTGDDISKTDIDSGLVVYQGSTGNIQDYGSGIDYYSLLLDSSGITFTLQADLQVAADLEIATDTTLNCNGYNLTVGGSITGNGTLTGGTGTIDVNGDLIIDTYSATSGTTSVGGDLGVTTFTHNSGLVIIDGTGTSRITENSGFYDFYCTSPGKTIRFMDGNTQTINGSFTITGTVVNKINLLSQTTGTQWSIDNAGDNENVTYARIQDSQVTGAPGNHITATYSDDLGNNTTAGDPRWVFPSSKVWSGAVDYDWSNSGNWTGGVPVAGDNILIPAGPARQPVLDTNVDLDTINISIENGARITTGVFNFIVGSIDCYGTLDATGQPGARGVTVSGNLSGTGDFIAGSGAVNIGGTIGITSYSATSSTTTVQGNWDVANFTHNDGQVEFTGTGISVIFVNTAFYDFTCQTAGKTIQFAAGETQTVTNLFTIQGASGNPVFLRSTVNGSYWLLNVVNSANVTFADVMDSNAQGGIVIVADESTDRGNNENWSFYRVIEGSETGDYDEDGKIDHIVVYLDSNLSLNDQFNGFMVEITEYGYTDSDTGITPGDHIFHINFEEGLYLDTDATPLWRITDSANLEYSIANEPVTSDDEIPVDGARPIIAHTLAIADKDEIFICFSEPVQTPGGGVIMLADFTGYEGAASIDGEPVRITRDGAGTEEVLLTLSANVTADEVVNELEISTTALIDTAGLPLVAQTHRVSDLGLGLTGDGIIQPIWARDETTRIGEITGPGYISMFDNTMWLRDQDITLQAHIHEDIPGDDLNVKLFYDVNTSSDYLQHTLWLPEIKTEQYSGIVPQYNPNARPVTGTTVAPQMGAQLRNFILREEKRNTVDGNTIEFVFKILSSRLFCVRVGNPQAVNWYRTLSPWAFSIHDILSHKSDVTILNNVINPTLGEKSYLHFILSKAGTVTITVFDLKGDIVDVLYKGRKNTGDYAISWDGRNRSDRIVARGVYFIRIIAPGISQVRKVLVVK